MAWEPGKPTDNENEYFARQDAEWRAARRVELDRERASKAAEAVTLKCPRDGTALNERKVGNVTVDVCSTCGGVWLDPGEMEMLTHVSKSDMQSAIRNIGVAGK